MFMLAEFWVAVAFFVFLGILIYMKVPSMMSAGLDKRAADIRAELDEARRLREEAKTILADYRQKQADAEKEAEGIIAQAKHEAEVMRAETEKSLQASLERRTRLAEEKIARAEAQAVNDVRSAAVDTALGAAERIISQKTAGATGSQLIDQGINELKSKFN